MSNNFALETRAEKGLNYTFTGGWGGWVAGLCDNNANLSAAASYR